MMLQRMAQNFQFQFETTFWIAARMRLDGTMQEEDSSITRSHSTQTIPAEREIFIRIKQATKWDMPIKPGAYC